MTKFDPHKNFAVSVIAAGPSPALSGTSLTLLPGQGALFPNPSVSGAFNCTVWPEGALPTVANAEIVRVTARAGDVLTIARAQEGSIAQPITAGMAIAATITSKSLTDLEAVLNGGSMSVLGGASSISVDPVTGDFVVTTGSVERARISTAGVFTGLERKVFFNVLDYGAKGDGATDDTVAIQAAITAACAVHGTVYFPQPSNYYRVVCATPLTITPPSGTQVYMNMIGPPDPAAIRYEGANGGTVFKSLGWKTSNISNINVFVATATGVVCWDLDVDATKISSSSLVFNNCRCYIGDGNGNVGWRMGHTGGGSSEMSWIDWVNCSVSGGTGSGTTQLGWVSEHPNAFLFKWWGCQGLFLDKAFTNTSTAGAGSTAGGDAMSFFGCGTSNCSVDFEFQSAGSYLIEGGRYEVGKKFLVISNGSTQVTVSVRDVKGATYSPSDNCVFDIANITYNGGRPVNLLLDNVVFDGTDYTAAFITMQGAATRPSLLRVRGGSVRSLVDPIYTLVTDTAMAVEIENVQQTNSSKQPVIMYSLPVRALTYSASITPAGPKGPIWPLVVTNGTAFTINAPTLPVKGTVRTFDIKNSSGGAMGLITWDVVFLLAGAFTNPANGKRRTIQFYYDGTSWIEVNRAAADI